MRPDLARHVTRLIQIPAQRLMLGVGTDVEQRHAAKLRARKAIGLNSRLVDGQKPQALGVEHPHRHRRTGEQCAVALLALQRSAVSQLALGDVLQRTDQAHDLSRLRDGPPLAAHPDGLATPGGHRQLQVPGLTPKPGGVECGLERLAGFGS